MKMNRSNKGFTLVEIMIVVVIIGLLAAMAIPAFNKVRRSSNAKAMLNDARQVGSAAQIYFMENGATTANIGYNSTSGLVSGDIAPWVKQLSKGMTVSDNVTVANGFTMSKPGAYDGAVETFDAEGKRTSNTAE